MKKSEMVYDLSVFMDNNKISIKNPCYTDYIPSSLSYDEVESIIDFLVEKGMLPPTTKLSVINATDNGWDEED